MTITVYHGTTSKHYDSLQAGIDLTKSDRETDFGLGFYVTTNLEQAKKFALRGCQKHNAKEDRRYSRDKRYRKQYVTGKIFTYYLDYDGILQLDKYIFKEANDNWRHFIYNNRIVQYKKECNAGYNNGIEPRYDFVEGPLADGNMTDLDLVSLGYMSEEEFIPTITPIGSQMSLHTKEALSYLKFKGEVMTIC